MKILDCLRCRHRTLISTGAFWSCGTCGYAITQTALFAEQDRQSRERCASASTLSRSHR